MSSIPQPGLPQLQPPQPDNSPQGLSWEGEKMFNIYIYDYCSKRGFRNTARELRLEAEISPDSTPPINARQGLLFEWWSVFWVLFTAKASGNGSEDAMLYTQHQANQFMQRQQRTQGQGLPPGQLAPPAGMPHQPPAPVSRLPNGVNTRSGLMPFVGNGPMSNGVGPPQGSLQPGGPNTFMSGGIPQSNGIPGQTGPPPPQSAPPGTGQNFQQMLPGQRPSVGGMPQQPPQQPQRGPNGPFQSPNMGNSPQNPPGPQPSQQPLSQPPMGQLGGPSPHMLRGMLPPNQGMNPMNPQQAPPGAPGNPQPPTQYPQLGRSPSRAGTPGQGQGGMMHSSPSMGNRQPPLGGPMMPGSMMGQNPDALNGQIMNIPTATLIQIRQELGIGSGEISTLTSQDKTKIVNTFRARAQPPKPGENAAAGPSNPMMQPPNQQQRNNPQRNQQQPQQQRIKRNSTSPGEEHENLPRNETSPPDRKRPRRSPMEQPQTLPQGINNFNPQQQQQHQMPPQPGGPPGMMGPQGPGMMVMRGQPNPMVGVNGGVPHPGQPSMGIGAMGMGGGQSMGVPPHLGNPQMHPGGNMTPHMAQTREQALRQHQQNMLPKGPQQSSGLGNMPGNASSPPSDQSFNVNLGGPLNPGQGGPGFGQNRMAPKTMMPPPSTGMNGPAKDQNSAAPSGTPGNSKNLSQNPGMPTNHGSPRNPPPSAGQTPNANGTGPPTPAPANQQNQNSVGPGPNQGSNLGLGGQNMTPSPSSILGSSQGMNPSSMSGQSPMGGDTTGNIFSTDFIQSVASSLDEFDPHHLFRPDGDINFERDFGQWFNPDDVPSFDMK